MTNENLLNILFDAMGATPEQRLKAQELIKAAEQAEELELQNKEAAAEAEKEAYLSKLFDTKRDGTRFPIRSGAI